MLVVLELCCVGRFGLLAGFACTLLKVLTGCFSFVCYGCYYLSFGLGYLRVCFGVSCAILCFCGVCWCC